MALVNKVVAVVVSRLDAELASKAAASLVQPHKTLEPIVGDLLERLRKVKLLRESRGLNHWEAFAPAYLQKILDRVESRRRWRNEAFYRENHARAMAFARAYLKNLQDAEDAVGEAYVKLLSGETTSEHFMRALKQIVLNRLTRSRIEARLFMCFDRGLEDDQSQSGQEDM